MGKKLKRFWKITRVILIILILLFAAIVILPYVFKGKIMTAVKQEINNNVEATVDFRDFNLSLLYHFPNFSFQLDGLTVVGQHEFEGDTLAKIESVSAVINLFSVFKGEVYEIRKISIDHPDVFLYVKDKETVNWDIMPESTDQQASAQDQEEESSESAFAISLRKFEIVGANFVYKDIPGSMFISVRELDHRLSGDLSSDKTTLYTKTSIADLSFVQDGIRLVHKTSVDFSANIDANLKDEMYTFDNNKLKINELILEFEGSVAMTGDNPNILLTFNTPKNDFKNFLSLIPAIYMKDFEEIETKGQLALNGYVKGVYEEDKLPSFRLDVDVQNGEFRYPELPDAVKDIALKIHVNNPGGDVDNTLVDIKKFHFNMLDNPFDLNMTLKNPISDPFIAAGVNGTLDLSSLAKVYPLEAGESFSGTINANMQLKGKQSDVDNENYKNFDAFGSLLVKDLNYSLPSYEHPFSVRHAQMNFSPSYIDLVNLDFTYAESDMMVKGKMEDYIAYALGSGILKGDFTASSNNFNLNDFIADEEEVAKETSQPESFPEDTVELSVIRVPQDIDLRLNTQFTKLSYDNMNFENMKGDIVVKDESVIIQDLRGNIFSGSVILSGSYSTKNSDKPLLNFSVDIDKIRFTEAFEAFGIVKKYAPLFKHAMGDFSTAMSLNTELKADMMPDWKTFIANGILNTTSVKLNNFNTLNQLSSALKTDAFSTMDLNPIKLSFDIQDGKLIVKPVDLVLNGMKANLSGNTSVDRSIDYDLKMEIPSDMLGGEANKVVDGLISQMNAKGADFSKGNKIDMHFLIGGSLDNPSVTPSLSSTNKSIVDDVKQNIEEEIDKKKEEIKDKGKQEAQKILDDAEKHASNIINNARKQAEQVRKTARDAAQKVRDEADDHAKKLIEEGKKKGMLAEIAAKKTADEYKKNADAEADKLITEADKQANAIISAAKNKAENIRSEAQKKADNL